MGPKLQIAILQYHLIHVILHETRTLHQYPTRGRHHWVIESCLPEAHFAGRVALRVLLAKITRPIGCGTGPFRSFETPENANLVRGQVKVAEKGRGPVTKLRDFYAFNHHQQTMDRTRARIDIFASYSVWKKSSTSSTYYLYPVGQAWIVYGGQISDRMALN